MHSFNRGRWARLSKGAKSSLPFKRNSASAFTLAELLVAIVMLTVLVIIIGGMMASTSALIKTSDKNMDADSESRTVLDRMAGDFAAMVKRADVDYQFNNESNQQNASATLFFYSEAPAISASQATLYNSSASLVGYRINSQYQMERLGKGLQWTPNVATSADGEADGMVHLTYATSPATTVSTPLPGSSLNDVFPTVVAANSADVNYHVLGADVFRFDFWFLLKPFQQSDGTYAPAIYSNYPYDTRRQNPSHTSLRSIGLEDVQAIVVSIAIMDAGSRQLLTGNPNWSKIAGALPSPAGPFSPPGWEAEVANASSFAAAAGIPVPAAGQARIYQRTFNLVTPSNQ